MAKLYVGRARPCPVPGPIAVPGENCASRMSPRKRGPLQQNAGQDHSVSAYAKSPMHSSRFCGTQRCCRGSIPGLCGDFQTVSHSSLATPAFPQKGGSFGLIKRRDSEYESLQLLEYSHYMAVWPCVAHHRVPTTTFGNNHIFAFAQSYGFFDISTAGTPKENLCAQKRG